MGPTVFLITWCEVCKIVILTRVVYNLTSGAHCGKQVHTSLSSFYSYTSSLLIATEYPDVRSSCPAALGSMFSLSTAAQQALMHILDIRYSISSCECTNTYLIFFGGVHWGYFYIFNTFKFLNNDTSTTVESMSTYGGC
jgi:hypothetical protein